jgi:2-iminobutanoate/2-iminopropanoate deaminase
MPEGDASNSALRRISSTEEVYGYKMPFVPAIRVPAGHDLVFVAGVMGTPDGDDDAPDVDSEVHRLFRRMGRVLEASGATFTDVVLVTKYLVNVEDDNPVIARIMPEYFKELPTSTTVEVPRLVPLNVRMEVDAIAAVLPA